MKLLTSYRCVRGHHARSRSRAHKVEGHWESVCRNCGTPMLRLRKHRWVVRPSNWSPGDPAP
ncbi:hypothetical protein [Sphingomonas sp. LT1P40]|uniref:hypothetical protein n=1 Tax=Alteristakelama amylovorans TaxID=3096166 RepID=UPI002FCC6EE7